MKQILRLGACTVAAFVGVLAPASVAQADTANTTATADYVCESWTGTLLPRQGWALDGHNCTGPTDASWSPRTITNGELVWECDKFLARDAEFGPVRGVTCRPA